MTDDGIGWVAEDCAWRLYLRAGAYRWDEWRAFADVFGIQVVEHTMPSWLLAAHAGHRVFLDSRLSSREKARWFWHEVGHIAMHPGNCWYWDTQPWGYLVLGKQERQANEFAAAFPVWEGE